MSSFHAPPAMTFRPGSGLASLGAVFGFSTIGMEKNVKLDHASRVQRTPTIGGISQIHVDTVPISHNAYRHIGESHLAIHPFDKHCA